MRKLAEEKFEVGRDGFRRRKRRFPLYILNMWDETASADVEAAAGYPADLTRIMNEGGCTAQQTSRVDETAFYLKKMPWRAPTARENSVLDFQTSKDRLTLWWATDAVVEAHSENRRALKSNPTAGHTHRGNQNWKRHVYPNVHCSTIYNSQDMEAT